MVIQNLSVKINFLKRVSLKIHHFRSMNLLQNESTGVPREQIHFSYKNVKEKRHIDSSILKQKMSGYQEVMKHKMFIQSCHLRPVHTRNDNYKVLIASLIIQHNDRNHGITFRVIFFYTLTANQNLNEHLKQQATAFIINQNFEWLLVWTLIWLLL